MPILTPDVLPIEKYHDSIQPPEEVWLSKTSIRDYQRMGPAWWKMAYVAREIEKPSPGGVVQGAALDCLLTEGRDAFIVRYPVLPDDAPNRPTKKQINAKKPSPETVEAIAWWKDWDASYPEGIILTQDDRNILEDAAEAVRSHPLWAEIVTCDEQLSVRRHSGSLDLGLQSRPDWLSQDRRTLFDLKKTRSLDMFGKQAIDIGYHLQAAIADWCLSSEYGPLERAYLVAVEWERGARCRVFEIPRTALDAGERIMRETAAEISGRLRRDDWGDVPPINEPLQIPEWMLRKMEREAQPEIA